jgi:hypothetical protein
MELIDNGFCSVFSSAVILFLHKLNMVSKRRTKNGSHSIFSAPPVLEIAFTPPHSHLLLEIFRKYIPE